MATLRILAPNDSRHMNAIIYGASGVGKTWLAGSAASAHRTLIIDFDAGTSTLRGVENVDVFRPAGIYDIQEIYRWLRHSEHPYGVIVLDSLTECSRKYSMGHVMGELLEGSDEYSDLTEATTPSMAAWGKIRAQMTKMIRAFRDLAYLQLESQRVHVLMTALERYNEEVDTYSPQLIGSLSLEVGAAVDCVFRLSRQRVEDDNGVQVVRRHLLTVEHVDPRGRIYQAKNRGGRLPQGIWNPNMADILKTWEGETE